MLGSVSSILRTIINPSFVTMIQEGGGGEGKEEETKNKKQKTQWNQKRYLQTHVHSSISHLHPKGRSMIICANQIPCRLWGGTVR